MRAINSQSNVCPWLAGRRNRVTKSLQFVRACVKLYKLKQTEELKLKLNQLFKNYMNRHTARCTSPVSMVLQRKLVFS